MDAGMGEIADKIRGANNSAREELSRRVGKALKTGLPVQGAKEISRARYYLYEAELALSGSVIHD